MNDPSWNIPEDIRSLILMHSDYGTSMSLCTVDREYYRIGNIWWLWFSKIQRRRPNFHPNREIFPVVRLRKLYRGMERTGSLYRHSGDHDLLTKVEPNNNLISVYARRKSGVLEFSSHYTVCVDLYGNVHEVSPGGVLRQIAALSNIVDVAVSPYFTAYLDDQGTIHVRFTHTGEVITVTQLSNIVYIHTTSCYYMRAGVYAINNKGRAYGIHPSPLCVSVNPIHQRFNLQQIVDDDVIDILLDTDGNVHVGNVYSGSSTYTRICELPKIGHIYGGCVRMVCLAENGGVYFFTEAGCERLCRNILQMSGNTHHVLCVTGQGQLDTYTIYHNISVSRSKLPYDVLYGTILYERVSLLILDDHPKTECYNGV